MDNEFITELEDRLFVLCCDLESTPWFFFIKFWTLKIKIEQLQHIIRLANYYK